MGFISRAANEPVGEIKDFGNLALPSGYLPCDGSAVSRTTYAELFAKVGTQFGVGDGSTTFNVPDRRRRVSVGDGGVASGTLGNTVGSAGGAETNTLTTSHMPSHAHGVYTASLQGLAGGGFNYAGGDASGFTGTGSTQSNGSGTPHNIMQPSLVCKIGIKY